jgi:2-methylcitrate dehydratase PrpD
MSATRRLSAYVASLSYDDLPTEAIAKAKDCLLDYIAYTSFGCDEDPAHILGIAFREMGGREECTVIGQDWRLPAINAAFLNGATGHMTELDDTHRGTGSHPGDSILPAALAMAEVQHASGKDLIAAIVSGYEADIRVGEAVMPGHYSKGWHISGTINTFGAAVAAGKLLNLDATAMTHNMGIASGQAAGNFAHVKERGMMKDFNPGRAASNGVFSAILAQKGFTGATGALEHPKGFCALYSDTVDLDKLTKDFGDSFRILEVGHKPFPGCRHIHPARDALLSILSEQGPLSPDQVHKITARLLSIIASEMDDYEPWAPGKGIYGPTFSTQFNLALAFLEGEKGLRRWLKDNTYGLEKAKDPAMHRLMEKIEVVPDEEMTKAWPFTWSSVLTLETSKGTFNKRIDYPKGEPENPLSGRELWDKFTLLTTARAYTLEQSRRIGEAVEGLESIEDVAQITGLLTPSRELTGQN